MKTKYIRRLLIIAQNAVYSLGVPVLNIVVSAVIVRRASIELWGAFVPLLIWVQLSAHILGWGNKEYLLRAFSLHPSHMADYWQTSLWTRLRLAPLVIFVFVLGGFTPIQVMLTAVWVLSQLLTQAHEVWVVYRRDFLFALLVEALVVACTLSGILWQGKNATPDFLLQLFTATAVLEALIWLWRYQSQTSITLKTLPDFQWTYFHEALPFFLLGFSGMLQSRIDLYCVSYYLPQKTVGEYQIYINLLLYLQSVSVFIVVPFVKSLYRLQSAAIWRLALRLFAVGLALSFPMLIAASLLLRWVYHYDVPLNLLLIGGFFVLPIYFYLPIIYWLYKLEKQTAVIFINLFGIVLNLLGNLLLLPRLNLVGAMLAIAIAQWGMLAAYLVYVAQQTAVDKPNLSQLFSET